MAISSLNDIKKGTNVEINGEPYRVVEANFLRMQMRKPVMQTKLKNLANGKVLEISFKPGDKVIEAELEHIKATYLYSDENNSYFMEAVSYEQFSVPKDNIKNQLKFLLENQEVEVLKFKGNALSIQLPNKVDLKVTEAPPGIRGDSSQGATKQITLETGMHINAPLFVKQGDVVKINTETGEYVERV
ncbi:elongation factor P [Candidatus Falkowbacteria bacterium]|nr:elongation factor P [Candidatus Falkowbacteria bacterium]